MLSTREIKQRIRSITSIKQITRAMEMVAASRLKRVGVQGYCFEDIYREDASGSEQAYFLQSARKIPSVVYRQRARGGKCQDCSDYSR